MMSELRSLFASFFIVEWIIRIVMLFIVPRKARQASANAWLLLIMIVPLFGTIVFYMFGDPKLSRRRRKQLQDVTKLTSKELRSLHERHDELFPAILNDDYETIAKLATKLGGLPPMSGNAVEFYADYDEIFTIIAKAIDRAKEYVHVQYYIAAYDDATKVIFEALLRAQKRGVTVRFLYDKLLSRRYKGSRQMERMLKEAGIDVREMLPLHMVPGANFTRPDLRNHRKVVIIDGVTAFSGSQNLINKSYNRRDNVMYEEVVAKMSGPIVWQLNNVFRSDWMAETDDALLSIVEDDDVPPKEGPVTAQVLPSGPAHEYENNLKLYTAMVHAAKKCVRIVVPYFIPDESFLDALIAAAHRGVQVTMINSEVIDKVLAGHAQRSYYDDLLRVGIEIYLYKKPAFLHAKQVIIDDDVAIVGSSNLDIRSFELDFELNTILYDKEVVQRLLLIDAGYLKKSKMITMKDWAKRPLKYKMLDTVARLTAALQ